ncbi:MAG TPA: hypothetical protein VH969_31640, partial [Actinophytocola sp.]
DGTRLRLGLQITETTVEAVPFIAGIETGWGQVLDHLADAVSTAKRAKRAKRANRTKRTSKEKEAQP